jgi:type IV secretion system protein VirB9
MHQTSPWFAAAWLIVSLGAALNPLSTQAQTPAQRPDPRLKNVIYDPQAVVAVPVKRGIVTLVVLDADETILEVATGLGSDCNKPEASWCVAAQPGGRTLFVKPKSQATGSNNLAVVSNLRTHALRFDLLPDGDTRAPVYRLNIQAPAPRSAPSNPGMAATAQLNLQSLPPLPPLPAPPTAEELLAQRLDTAPHVLNSQYSLAEGPGSADILPSLVFDDGRFTYLRFANNREVPAIFHVLGDGSETLVNARMQDDLLVVDRVSRHLVLRAGSAVVGLWNEAFNLDGVPPSEGTTVAGVRRVLKPDPELAGAASNRPNPSGAHHD